jgi:aspartyl-tRNA(Asn)/glutamyl-tRNA(Gln) amidotransferase subunit B
MELVTEPVINSAKQASDFAEELQLILRILDVSSADMERGEMRVEANISISPEEGKFGAKVEVKNLNSFRSVSRAIEFELKRQAEVLEKGGRVVQETRGWDEDRGVSFSQRLKEDSHDYRYFPDPDLPKIKISEVKEFNTAYIRSSLPELPFAKRERFASSFNLKPEEARMLVANPVLGDFFDKVALVLKEPEQIRLAANYVISDLASHVKNSGRLDIKAEDFSKLIKMSVDSKVSSRGTKDILKIMHDLGGDPELIASQAGLFQKSSESDLLPTVDFVLEKNKKIVDDYRGGKQSALQFLIGQCMKGLKGSGNPKVLSDLIKKRIG